MIKKLITADILVDRSDKKNVFMWAPSLTGVNDLELKREECVLNDTYHGVHMHFQVYSELKAGDWCLFYGQPSLVLEIEKDVAKIKTQTILSASDAEMMNSIKKGDKVYKEGDSGEMTHSFSIAQLEKIVATTDKEVPLPRIPMEFIEKYQATSFGKPEKVNLECVHSEDAPRLDDWRVATTTSNKCIIHEYKPYTREEVIDKFEEFLNDIDMIHNGQSVSHKEFYKWLYENL